MKSAIFLALLVVLPACKLTLPPVPAPDDTCGAAKFEYLRGAAEAQVKATIFNQPMRVIPHQGHVTLDYLPERINFALDAAGNVIGITCG